MKKNKKIIFSLLLTLPLIIPNNVMATEYIKCGTDKQFPFVLVDLISKFFIIIKIVVPILLVISGMISFLKVTYSSNTDEELKKAKTSLVNNVIAAVIIFFIISIVNFAVGLVAGSNNQFMSCLNCFIKPERCTKINVTDDEIVPGYGNPTNNGNQNNQTNTGSNNKIENRNGVTYIDGILIVNKTYSVPENYKPRDDINPAAYTEKDPSYLTQETLKAYNEIVEAAKKDGINLFIVSGYRSYAYQSTLYNNYVAADGKQEADKYSARPGNSEHQTGLAIDFNDASSERFPGTPEATWLNDNCYKYGFILRYPKGKENITGYKYEPWHMRYVGKELAQELYNNGNWITLEEKYNLTSVYPN